MRQPKYLNSPETPLFHKGATLYNIATARAAAHKGAQVIAVEGYVDVIAMVTAGFEATVAPLGTALTAEQLALIWKMADEPVLCFDGDAAGRRAAYRAVDIALPLLRPGKSLKFATLPEGQDPDDLVRTGGREAVVEVIGGARPLADVLWMRETESKPLRHARAPRRAGGAPRRGHGDDRRRDGAQILPAGFRRPAAEPARPAGAPSRTRQAAGGHSAIETGRAQLERRSSWSDRKPQGRGGFARRTRRRGSPAARLTWSRARSWRRAPCIAAIAPPFRAARR